MAEPASRRPDRDDAYFAALSQAVEAGEYTPRRPGLTLLVLYVRDLEASRAFYADLGLTLHREQHGGGPVHYAATLEGGGVVLELYPCGDGPPTRTRLGLRFRQPNALVAAVIRHTAALGDPATVVDPDGSAVELRSD